MTDEPREGDVRDDRGKAAPKEAGGPPKKNIGAGNVIVGVLGEERS